MTGSELLVQLSMTGVLLVHGLGWWCKGDSSNRRMGDSSTHACGGYRRRGDPLRLWWAWVQVRSAVEGKERVAGELLEVERQIMATERKIELEKELQAAYGAKDEGEDVMAGMKKEIHRMELRYAQLMRRQEELMVEMERSIFKRDMIGVRGKLQQGGGASGKASTKGDVKKVVADLAKRAADMEAEIGRYERQVRELHDDEEGLHAAYTLRRHERQVLV